MRAAHGMSAVWIAVIAGCSQYTPAPPPAAPPSAPGQAASAKQSPAQPAAAASAPKPSSRPAGQSGMTAGMQAMGGAIGMAPLDASSGGPGAVASAGPANGIRALAAPQPAAPTGATVVPAKRGVGEKGRGYGSGLIATPAAVYFQARERIAFDIQVPHALQLYKATNGSGPKTHQEFEQKILRENQIELPQLPQGHYYQYDPAREQLMVVQPES